MTSKPEHRVRRIYNEPTHEGGTRVLVDRMWPRGLSVPVPGAKVTVGMAPPL